MDLVVGYVFEKAPKHWDEWSSDEGELDSAIAAQAAGSKEPLRWADECKADDSLCSTWLRDIGGQVSNYDRKLLFRHVPGLPETALQQLVATTTSTKIEFLSNQPQQQQQQISKMQMRRVLQTALEQLVKRQPDVGELLRHWLATADKANRKSKNAARDHTKKYECKRKRSSEV